MHADIVENKLFTLPQGKTLLEDAELLFTGPTRTRLMTFQQWLWVAIDGHNRSTRDRNHMYFRMNSVSDQHWLYDELPFFKPHSNTLFDAGDKGIHCRFGMKGIIAESHYDAGENFAASIGGLRRWIMLHPDQCNNLYIIRKPSVSARHSKVNWSRPDYEKYPRFKVAKANEVILQGGEILYVPTYWFHFIVSLNVNFQCNSRSNATLSRALLIRKCMTAADG